jgi:hypothetical protein
VSPHDEGSSGAADVRAALRAARTRDDGEIISAGDVLAKIPR